ASVRGAGSSRPGHRALALRAPARARGCDHTPTAYLPTGQRRRFFSEPVAHAARVLPRSQTVGAPDFDDVALCSGVHPARLLEQSLRDRGAAVRRPTPRLAARLAVRPASPGLLRSLSEAP